MVLKRHRSSVELFPHDVVELILERLPVKSLLRFKVVSNKWQSTIESTRFKKRHSITRRRLRGPDILLFSKDDMEQVRMAIGSSIVCTVKFPTSNSMACYGTCDGLVCLYCVYTESMVINPATRWHLSFPLSRIQEVMAERHRKEDHDFVSPKPGFGKDVFQGTYKPVWLYNSSDFGLDNVTTCEVFDFTSKSWKYLVPASPYRILAYQKPVYLDGSLYWLSECKETKVLSLDLHTETFHVSCKAPFSHIRDPHSVIMCILDNRLCVSQQNWPTQVIWSLDSSGWKKICSIDLTVCPIKAPSWVGKTEYAILPVAIVEGNRLLLHGRLYLQPMVIHDLQTKSYDLLFTPANSPHCVCYHQSLFSVSSN